MSEKLSNCCGAPLIGELDMCSYCKERAGIIFDTECELEQNERISRVVVLAWESGIEYDTNSAWRYIAGLLHGLDMMTVDNGLMCDEFRFLSDISVINSSNCIKRGA